MDFGRFGCKNNNSIIWIALIFVVIVFGGGASLLGINGLGVNNPPNTGFNNPTNTGFNPCCNTNNSCNTYSACSGYQNMPNQNAGLNSFSIPFLGPLGGILGGNGLFLLAVIVILFIVGDDDSCDDEPSNVEPNVVDNFYEASVSDIN
jgi:hypothetical protein